jgi:tetratricopeptide (TPR) repeat protein
MMPDQQTMSTQDFKSRFRDAIQIVNGPHPEYAVQLFKDLILEACEDHRADDEIVIQLRMYLGSALWRSDVYAQAVAVLEAALEDAVRTLGWENRITFSCAGNLCRALSGLGNVDEALRLAKMTYQKRIITFGEFDNGTLNSLNHLAQLYFEAGDFKQATSLMSSLYRRRRHAFGEDDDRTRSSKHNLALMQARRDNNKQDLLNLLVEHTNEFGSEHPSTIGVLEHLARIFELNGQLEAALETWREAELKLTHAFGEVALPTLASTQRRLKVQQALGDNQVGQQLAMVQETISRISGQSI